MTSSDIPNPEREEISVDGISIKGKVDNKAGEVKGKHPAIDPIAEKTASPKKEGGLDHKHRSADKPGTGHSGPEKGKHEASVEQEETPDVTQKVSTEDIEYVENRLIEQEKLAAEYLDLLKRKQADFENYRKRSQREIDEYKRYATTEVVLDILNLIDDFERAVESTRSSKEFDALLDGVLIIKKQFRNLLEKKYGVKNIEAVGKEFDPNMHDAIMIEESGQYDKDTVIEDLRKGYVMHDRIIRPSKVKVARAASTGADRGGGAPPGVSSHPPSRGTSAAGESEKNNERG